MSRPFSVEACDFSGWATRNDLKCSDGRVIRRDAFKNNDGITTCTKKQYPKRTDGTLCLKQSTARDSVKS